MLEKKRPNVAQHAMSELLKRFPSTKCSKKGHAEVVGFLYGLQKRPYSCHIMCYYVSHCCNL